MIDVWRLTKIISCDVMSRPMLQNTIFSMRKCYIEFRVVAFSKVVPDGWSILLQVSYPSSTPVRGVWGFWDCDIPMAGRATKCWECIGLAGRGLARIWTRIISFFFLAEWLAYILKPAWMTFWWWRSWAILCWTRPRFLFGAGRKSILLDCRLLLRHLLCRIRGRLWKWEWWGPWCFRRVASLCS